MLDSGGETTYYTDVFGGGYYVTSFVWWWVPAIAAITFVALAPKVRYQHHSCWSRAGATVSDLSYLYTI